VQLESAVELTRMDALSDRCLDLVDSRFRVALIYGIFQVVNIEHRCQIYVRVSGKVSTLAHMHQVGMVYQLVSVEGIHSSHIAGF
jgi:hypothetical protein